MLPSFQDELLLKIPSIFQDELVGKHGFLEDSGGRKRRRREEKTRGMEERNECTMRRIMHRDMERQRRQEMAGLYASLRSLLPLECIRGKRSISDHMQEAMNYIKKTETKIKELREKMDKQLCGSERGSDPDPTSFWVSVNSNYLRSRGGGVEILISSGSGFPLSRILMELINSNLRVKCCISTRACQRFLYTIQSEVNDSAAVCVDAPLLQQKLVSLIALG